MITSQEACTAVDSKPIYVIFSSTTSNMGRFIRFMTGYKYNHVAIALERDMQCIYSFARYRRNAPFAGGFVEESPLRYCDGVSAEVRVCEIPLPLDVYNNAFALIHSVCDNKDGYIYNMLSAALVPFRRKLKIDRAYTCLEFVSFVLSRCDIGVDDNDFMSIAELEQHLEPFVIYDGDIMKIANLRGWGNDLYRDGKGFSTACVSTLRQLARLFARTVRR